MKVEYNNLYTHFIFTVYHRLPLIPGNFRERIEKYITGVVKNNGCQLYSIYANPEHVHCLISRSPKISEEYIAEVIADSSEKFINENKLSNGKFQWQDSCSAFSVSKSHIPKVCTYIENQSIHHQKIDSQSEHEQFVAFYQKTIRPKLGN
jgi:REP element-mobilizing transposase RayT